MESKINCNVAVAFGLWIITFAASNAFCEIVDGPFEKNFELKEAGLHRKSDNRIDQLYIGTIYLFKHTNEDKYTIGSPTLDGLVDETYFFETDEIISHTMHQRFMSLELKEDRLLVLSFVYFADAQKFYDWSSRYEHANRLSAGPFKLIMKSTLSAQFVVLTMYEIDNENLLCEFKNPNDESKEDMSQVQLVVPTKSFSHTDIYLQKRVGLIAKKTGNVELYYILNFYEDEDAVNFVNAIRGKSGYITEKSDELASLDTDYALNA